MKLVMRVIRFRCWNMVLKHWVDPEHFTVRGDGTLGWIDGKTHKWSAHLAQQEDHYILMQSSELLDLHGKEIYEGDVLLSREDPGPFCNPECRYLVEFFDGSFRIRHKAKHHVDTDELFCFNKQAEIIGNCYENPDLLEQPRRGRHDHRDRRLHGF